MSGRLESLRSRLRGDARFASLLQFVKFGIVGLSNTLISLGVYYLCFYVLRMHYQLANVLSFLVSVTNAYYWNSRYVFHAGRRLGWKRTLWAYVKTVVSYGITFLLGTLLLTVWVEAVRLSAGIAPLVNLLFTIPLNFLLNKHWTFRRKTGEASTDEPAADGSKVANAPPDGWQANTPDASAPVADAPNADAPDADAPLTDAPITDTPDADASLTDTPNADAPDTDAPITDTPNADAPITDALVLDTPDADVPNGDSKSTDAPTADTRPTA